MSESESEDEILDRIEAALRRIASAAEAGKTAPPAGEAIDPEALDRADRAALADALDGIIQRLRAGLSPPEGTE